MSKLKEDIGREIDRILSNYLTASKEYTWNEINLYGGIAGQILMLGVAGIVRNNANESNKLFEDIEHSMDLVEKYFQQINPTFSGGLSGWAWAIQFLDKKNIVDIPEGFFIEIDNMLEIKLNNFLDNDVYDQLNGALGIARYFIARGNRDVLIRVIDYLDRKAHKINKEVIWTHVPWYDKKNPFYDFGLAHGVPGILHVVSKCHQLGIKQNKCSELIRGGLNFLFNNIQNVNEVGSYFPNKIEVSQYKQGKSPLQLSRLAWCYGDLGTFYIINEISRQMGLEEYYRESENYLLQTTHRRTFESTHYYDAGFCHGTSGIAHLYNRLFLKTKNMQFHEASVFWFKKTLEYVTRDSGDGNYKYLLGNFEDRKLQENNQLLEGDAGVALSYLAFLYPDLCVWDECMMLN
ncbi:hypothetical protein EO244_00470 [Ancylomarina salipaludis]|uniref:Lanthionine synthetase n=1 Tax=Ancylomarina salipaludis TaxID=2501299 RepID=A0A4Q1JPZ7_9BACT|nr:lanthionine synthetase C family protein [Ancylomarina salipaludis]RXQ97396.1 hypothetical protein EO244_00470 [Ancylomarina salipaludis]